MRNTITHQCKGCKNRFELYGLVVRNAICPVCGEGQIEPMAESLAVLNIMAVPVRIEGRKICLN